MDSVNPVDIAVGLVVKAVFLAIVLSIALPLKALIDKGAKLGYNKLRESARKKVKMQVKKELLEGVIAEEAT